MVIGTKVGRAKHMRIMPGGALETEHSLSGPSSIFVGKKLDEHRGSFILEYPMDKGHVVDGGWDGRWDEYCLVARYCWSMAWLGFSACIPFNVSQLSRRFYVDTDHTV